MTTEEKKKIREFKTGATRDTDINKPDYEGFISPIVIKRYGEYQKEWKDIAWAAGIFEGEGWIGYYHQKGRIRKDGTPSSPKGYKYPRLGISLTDLDVLQSFQSIIGGKIKGPYKNKNGKKPYWSWSLCSEDKVFGVCFLLYPYMGFRRKQKMIEIFGERIKRGESTEEIGGFFSPTVIDLYGKYMNKHRIQPDGNLRESDNWQKGIPKDQYMKSILRHIEDMWLEHRGFESRDGLEEAICGVLFNAMGYLQELLKEREYG